MKQSFKISGIELSFNPTLTGGAPDRIKLGELSGNVEFEEGEYQQYMTFNRELINDIPKIAENCYSTISKIMDKEDARSTVRRKEFETERAEERAREKEHQEELNKMRNASEL